MGRSPFAVLELALKKVQRSLPQYDVQLKLDKSPVTVADYGSQTVVSFILEHELPAGPFSLVVEEEVLNHITQLVNDTLAIQVTSPLSAKSVFATIDSGRLEGGSNGRHWVLDPIDGIKG
ncbi:hypothetical protein Ancab_039224 [Ancistrocladus abbreviatus]